MRFALYTALTLALTGVGFLWYVHRTATRDAERAVRFHASFVAATILQTSLRASDFERPVRGRRLRALDNLFRRQVLVGGALRVKLYDREGRVTYSNDHALIGTRPEEPDAIDTLRGERVLDVARLNHEGGSGRDRKVLETYVPVRLNAKRPVGVFELYQDYGPVAAATRAAFAPVAIALSVALLALFAALFPILRQVTRRLRAHFDEIEHQALHDQLTGLPNRVLFARRVEQAAQQARRDGGAFAVLLLDLDHFKEINDTLGHASGDRVLETVAGRLSSVVEQDDTVARLGGDEFGILALRPRLAIDALALADRLRAALRDPFTVDGVLLEIDASAGVALAPVHGGDAETLIRRADIALYAAKDAHTGVGLYAFAHDHHSPQRLQLVAELRRAIGAGELVCFYQPQAVLATGLLCGAEALVRWRHPTRGLLGPETFVPLAERSGLIRDLTRQVLAQALAQCRAWHEQGAELAVSVNITSRDLLDLNLPDEVASLLAAAGLDACFLELEITESTILADPVRARTVLGRLGDLGVRLAIDDFGTGASSLGYLKRLPVDVLKIDRSFVLSVDTDEENATIVRSTITLGHNLGLSVVAEGIETEAAWWILRRFGCDVGQGHFLGRPAPAASFDLTRAARAGAAPRNRSAPGAGRPVWPRWAEPEAATTASGRYSAVQPPSTMRLAPVTNEASSEAR